MAKKRKANESYVVCITNEGFSGSLEVRKLYQVLRDDESLERGLLRVRDESGDDYLYPAEWFLEVDLAPRARRLLAEKT